jgi:hypothetical protein
MTRTESKEPLCVDGEMTIYTATEIKLRLMVALTRAERLGKSLRYLKHSGAVVEILEFCNLTGQFDDHIVPVDNR